MDYIVIIFIDVLNSKWVILIYLLDLCVCVCRIVGTMVKVLELVINLRGRIEMKDCMNNKNGFCMEFDDYLGENFCETCDKNCPFYKAKQDEDNFNLRGEIEMKDC